jgi:hypothetical protein
VTLPPANKKTGSTGGFLASRPREYVTSLASRHAEPRAICICCLTKKTNQDAPGSCFRMLAAVGIRIRRRARGGVYSVIAAVSSVTATSHHHTQRRRWRVLLPCGLLAQIPRVSRGRGAETRPKLGSCPFRCLKRRHTPCHPFSYLHPRFAVPPLKADGCCMLEARSREIVERSGMMDIEQQGRTSGDTCMECERGQGRPVGKDRAKGGWKYGLFAI